MASVLSCPDCDEKYSIGPEHAGARFACRGCGREIAVSEQPAPATGAAEPARAVAAGAADQAAGQAAGSGPFDRDRFLVNQKRVSLHERYYVFDDQQQQLLFVDRPTRWLRQFAMILGAVITFFGLGLLSLVVHGALEGAGIEGAVLEGVLITSLGLTLVLTVLVAVALSPKRHVTFHPDDSKEQRRRPLLTAHQDQKIALLRSTYTITGVDGAHLGTAVKNNLSNFFRKQWRILGPGGDLLAVVKEDSVLKALLRRLLGPLFGLLRTNFVYFEADGSSRLGEFNRKLTLFDRYVLDLSADPARKLDRRLALATGVLLDTGERR